MMKRRAVITGIGVVAPNGIGKDTFWENTKNGKSATKRVENFDISQFNTKVAAQVEDFDPLKLGLSI